MDLLQAFGWLALAMAALMLGGWRWERAHRNAGIVDVLWATGMGLAAFDVGTLAGSTATAAAAGAMPCTRQDGGTRP